MKYKATVSFAGQVSMKKGETRELESSLAKPLLKAGYIEEVKKAVKPKATEQSDD